MAELGNRASSLRARANRQCGGRLWSLGKFRHAEWVHAWQANGSTASAEVRISSSVKALGSLPVLTGHRGCLGSRFQLFATRRDGFGFVMSTRGFVPYFGLFPRKEIIMYR